MAQVDLAREIVQEDENAAADVEIHSLYRDHGSARHGAVAGRDVVNTDVTISELDHRLDDAIVSLQPHW